MNDNDRGKPMISEKKIVIVSLRTSQITKWNGLGSNSGLRRERPATNPFLWFSQQIPIIWLIRLTGRSLKWRRALPSVWGNWIFVSYWDAFYVSRAHISIGGHKRAVRCSIRQRRRGELHIQDVPRVKVTTSGECSLF